MMNEIISWDSSSTMLSNRKRRAGSKKRITNELTPSKLLTITSQFRALHLTYNITNKSSLYRKCY